MSSNQTHRRIAAQKPSARRLTATLVIAIAGGLGAVLPAGFTEAQLSAKVEAHEPYQIVITDERAMVRCGPGAAYYPVVEALPVGSVLTTDGETSSGWLRVRYPKNATALVSDDSVDVRTDTQTAVLSRPAALSAFNVSTGARGSWSKLLAEPLAAGTELVIVREAFNDLTGELVGYEVEPPEEARAFIRTSFTRRATSADIANAPSGTPASTIQQAAPQASQPVTPAADPVDAPTDVVTDLTPPADQTPAGRVEDAAPNREISATPATADGALTPSGVQAVRPNARPRVGAAPADQNQQPSEARPAGGETAAPEPEAAAPMTLRNLDDLESAFEAVQAQPLSEAEFDQLLAEVERMIEAEPADSGLRPVIESRRDVLVIRKRVQDAWRANAEAAQVAQTTADEITSEIRRLQVERSYSAIGRLLPSAVYDGKRLPRMYRVQSVDTTEAPRTLGYIRPDPKLGLESKLNPTVGVVGTPRLDPRLNLLIIEPIKIDVIGAGG